MAREGARMETLVNVNRSGALQAAACAAAQQFPIPEPAKRELDRVNYHRLTSRGRPAPEPGAENTAILSPLDKPGCGRVSSAEEWYGSRRPDLVRTWIAIPGKIAPAPEDRKWFGNVTKVSEGRPREMDGNIRVDFDIPLEKDFYQRHLLLLPKGKGNGPFPAAIAWTSSPPDYQEPEKFWGAYLAQRGYVVLTSGAFIRDYRHGLRGKIDPTGNFELSAIMEVTGFPETFSFEIPLPARLPRRKPSRTTSSDRCSESSGFRNGLDVSDRGSITRTPSMHPHPPMRGGFWHPCRGCSKGLPQESVREKTRPTWQAFPGGRIPVCCRFYVRAHSHPDRLPAHRLNLRRGSGHRRS
jgi:hypothetical protein